MLIAAYDPTPVKDGKLPARGGYGGVYLAEISNAIIVPIAVNIKSDSPDAVIRKKGIGGLLGRPEAEMIIGKPIVPEKIEGLKDLGEILKRRREDPKSVTRADLDRIKELQERLKRESDKVMLALAEMLPEEKRGSWGERVNHDDEGKEV